MHTTNRISKIISRPTFLVTLHVLGDFKQLSALEPKKNADSLLYLLQQLVRHDVACPNLKITSETNPNKKQLNIHNHDQNYWISYIAHRNNSQLLEAQSIFEWIPDDAKSLGYSSETYQQVLRLTDRAQHPKFHDIIHCKKSGSIMYDKDFLILTTK